MPFHKERLFSITLLDIMMYDTFCTLLWQNNYFLQAYKHIILKKEW